MRLHSLAPPALSHSFFCSLSAQVILRGTRSAGYGFVALATEEAAIKAVEALDKTELDGRPVIIEIAKPSEQKDKERKERKAKRRPGRRGSKAVPGEVTEAEANGEVTVVPEPAAAGTDEAAKPKKKKKNTVSLVQNCLQLVSVTCLLTFYYVLAQEQSKGCCRG